ncbi:MAG: addiction module toxin, HicA family [Bacteroidetes bacterium]|jgi:predicted RNA binding protein YcfA (HicA-like mRNA interferase family)|nr:addiction module toxin, HicA family [Bacteroidota bacterium]
MSNTPSLTPKELVKILEKKGFELDRSKGSHQIWLHPKSRKRVVVPMHNKDIPKGTFFSILKQAGIDKNEIL